MLGDLKVGLVLSGGGIRGLAHLGFLKALKEKGFTISHITGSSAGAISGALFAAGYDPDDMYRLFMKIKLYRFIRPVLMGKGLFNMELTSKIYHELIPHNSFEKLQIKLTITAVNLNDNRLEFVNHGELIPMILASGTVPGLFQPIRHQGKMYIDGGVLNNFPVEPLLGDCEYIIGGNCNDIGYIDPTTLSMKRMIERAAILRLNTDFTSKAHNCNLLFNPIGLGDFSGFEVRFAEYLFRTGYEHALEVIENSFSDYD